MKAQIAPESLFKKKRRLTYKKIFFVFGFNMTNKTIKSKKGAAAWLSWVLLIGISVVIGVFILNWARGMTTEHADDFKEKADRSLICGSMDIRINSLCQNTQTLNINVSNNNEAAIKSVLVLMIDIYGNPQLRETNTTIKPDEKKELKIVKQGIVQRIEVIPATFSGSKRIECQEKKVTTETIPIC